MVEAGAARAVVSSEKHRSMHRKLQPLKVKHVAQSGQNRTVPSFSAKLIISVTGL